MTQKTHHMLFLFDQETGVKGQLIVLHVDLSSFASVRKFAEEFSELENKLHILVNNAGFAFHPLRKITEDGVEQVRGRRNNKCLRISRKVTGSVTVSTGSYV